MKVDFLDLKKVNASYGEELKEACCRVIDSGWYVLGEECDLFEYEFAKYCNSRFAIGVGSGLDAISLILHSWIELGRLSPGDGVIVPSNTFIATVLAVTENGLTPIFVDPDEDTFNMELENIRTSCTEKVKVIIPVHLYGQSCKMADIVSFANEKNILVLDDCAQAHGAMDHGVKVGAHCDASAFSFYPGKNLGALGDGGMITTSDEELYKMAKSLRSYGSSKKYVHDHLGTNSRLDEIQAAMLRVKLKYLEEDIASRRRVAKKYREGLGRENLIVPRCDEESSHVWHLFVVRSKNRSKLMEELKSLGISTLIHYPIPPHQQRSYQQYSEIKMPIAEMLKDEVFSLPISPVHNDEEIEFVIKSINNSKYT